MLLDTTRTRTALGHMLTPHAFTCLLPVYHRDRADDLREALASICSNTLLPYEIVVCEDGELTAELNAEIDRVTSVPVRRIRNSGPPGLHHNLNAALPQVITPWVARCDADDINLADRFEKQVAYLVKHPHVDVLGCDIVEFDPDGRTCRKAMPSAPPDVVRWTAARNPINHMTAFIRTDALLACGGYPNVSQKEDYALWLVMLAHGGTLANLPEALVKARLGENFYARRGGMKNARSEWEILKLKLRTPGIPAGIASACFVLRVAALIGGPRMVGRVYRNLLRRPTAGS